ncbi:MAG: hypothetical protein OEY94_02820 [Alphaproteobacteria bacterium]|nr:hypothetical protein [Alphaproteobacteria bacterium]
MSWPYLFKSRKEKTALLFETIRQDPYFEDILYSLADFGYEMHFPFFGNVGLYIPHSIATEKLDSPEKQQAFADGFVQALGSENAPIARFHLCASLGQDVNTHSLLHEIIHFYQDMLGLYLIPIAERGVYPVHLDMQSFVSAFLFCEAWAEVEAIGASWRLKEKGVSSPWNGAMASADWRELAREFEKDMERGTMFEKASANIFNTWYEGKHRSFYEKHAAEIYSDMTEKYRKNAPDISEREIGKALRKLELPMVLIKIPKKKIPAYLTHLDWADERYSSIQSPHVQEKIAAHDSLYGVCDNTNVQDIRIGTPPYLWNRLRSASL